MNLHLLCQRRYELPATVTFLSHVNYSTSTLLIKVKTSYGSFYWIVLQCRTLHRQIQVMTITNVNVICFENEAESLSELPYLRLTKCRSSHIITYLLRNSGIFQNTMVQKCQKQILPARDKHVPSTSNLYRLFSRSILISILFP